MFVLALDIGTSSIRASIYDAKLEPRRTIQIKYRWPVFPDGRVELDAARVESLTARAIDRVLDGHRTPIDAVGISAFWHSLVGADAGGRALTPVLPWSDLRADDEASQLRERWNERQVHRVTGCRLHPSYWPARLRWFRRHEPRVFHRVDRWMSLTDLLERRWLGRDGSGMSQASATGLFAQDACDWDDDLVERCGISRDHLCRVVDLADGAELSPRLQRRWPMLAGARWVPAAGDGVLNNIGAGCVRRGRAAVMIGTSGALRVLWRPRPGERIRTPFGLWRYRLDANRVVAGGALSSGGNVREWILGITGHTRDAKATRDVDRRAAAVAPDAHGLTMLPSFAGTRSPDYQVHATGAIAGLTLATRPEDLLRAGMESIAYGLAAVFDQLRETAPVREIVAAGGALEHSPVWTGILADVLGRPIRLCRQSELTSRGAAAIALDHLGVLRLDSLPLPPGRLIEPNRARHRIYREARQRYQNLLARVP